ATYYHEVSTNHLNETEDDKNIRIRNINQKVQDLIQTNRSYSAEELGLLVRSFSMYTTGELDKRSKKIGIIFNQTESGLMIDQVFSPSSAEKARLIRGELITHINGISLKQDGRKILIDKIDKTRDQDSVRLSVVSPDKSTREVMCYPEYGEKISAVYEITYGSFNLIASGLLGVDGKIKDTADILKSIQSKPQDDSLRLTDAELVKLIDEVKNSLQIYSEMANRVDAGRYRPSHIGSLPELNIYVSNEDESGLIAGMRLTADEILQLVRAIGGRGAVLNWIVKDNAPIPEWVKQKVLEPSGFRDKAPLN
ncbi:MAG: hypothetical protein KDA70_19200, partial [Planctomycetaceae bacterium]|nr:hypothetical protein [Planctomycetaceae bacterium]